MQNKKTTISIFAIVLFFGIVSLVVFIKVRFLPTPVPVDDTMKNIALNNTAINNNNSVNRAPYDNQAKKYTFSYKTKPKVVFGNNNTEIISFETTLGTKYVIEYGKNQDYGNRVSSDIYETFHEVALKNLEPNTKYYYSVNVYTDNGGYNEDFSSSFITKSSIQYDYHFAVLGDSRPPTGFILPEEFHKIVENISEKNPNFVLFVGDMVQLSDIKNIDYKSATDAWNYFSDAISPVSQKIPVYLSLGNHDEPTNSIAIKRFREIWTYPNNGGGKIGWYDELTYWFDYSNSLFIVLNSNEPGYINSVSSEQWTWLEKVLSYSGFEHKFIFTHYPVMGSKRGVNEKSSDLHKLFLKNKVTAVFSGHDHVYCKYKKDDLYYIITGGAGSPLYSNTCLGTEQKSYHFIDASVEGSTITINAINENNEIIDTFSFSDSKN